MNKLYTIQKKKTEGLTPPNLWPSAYNTDDSINELINFYKEHLLCHFIPTHSFRCCFNAHDLTAEGF